MVLTVDGDDAIAAQPLREEGAGLDLDVVRGPDSASSDAWCAGSPGRSRARSAYSVPPRATFTNWTPRQMARIGMPRPAQCRERGARSCRGPGSSLEEGVVRVAAVKSGVDIASTADDESVEPFDDSVDPGLLERAVDADRGRAGGDEGMEDVPPQLESLKIAR